MKPMSNLATILVLFLTMTLTASAQDRYMVEFEKHSTGSDTGLEYMYNFKVMDYKSGTVVDGAEFAIATDMPAMPGAHHMHQVAGLPTGAEGEYSATLDFDMPGRWTLILRFTAPIREVVTLSDEIMGYEGAESINCATHDHDTHAEKSESTDHEMHDHHSHASAK